MSSVQSSGARKNAPEGLRSKQPKVDTKLSVEEIIEQLLSVKGTADSQVC